MAPIPRRLERDILDGAVHPPLPGSPHRRRAVSEISRSRRGDQLRPTTNVILRRSNSTASRASASQSAPGTPLISQALVPALINAANPSYVS